MKEKIEVRAKQIEEMLYPFLPEITGYQKTVIEAMHYTFKAGGKRLRPMLMLETYKLFGKEDAQIAPFMAAIEMIHTYSLVHDDLPALDNDDYRRGKKTAHVVFGEDMAILAGDALLNYAFETAAKAFDDLSMDQMKNGAKAMQILSKKAGIYGMIGGQVADVELTGKPMGMKELLFIHENKTSALIEASMMIGAAMAGANKEELDTIEQIAKSVGLAFQIQDDILDVTSSMEELGKPIGSDEKNHKTTYVSLAGMENAKQAVEDHTMNAIGKLDALPYENTFLRELLFYLINRSH